MTLLIDAPPRSGVLEALEALPIDTLSVDELRDALTTVGVVRGRVDAVEGRLLTAFNRLGGAQHEGATDTTAWLAAATKTSGRDARRAVKRAGVLDALPQLSDALAAGEISAAHVDAVAAIVPAPLLPKAAKLVAAAKTSTPEELAHKAQQLVIDNDGDDGAGRAARLKARQRVRFFDMDSGMRAMFGEWDPETTASIERAVDHVTDEIWRALHPTRNPTPLDDNSLKFRRAEAVSEIARRVLAGVTAAEARAAAAAGAAASGAAANDDAPAAATPAKPARARPAQPLVSLLIDYKTMLGDLRAKGISELFDGTPISPDTVRRLACDAAIIPMVLGSRGEVLNQGRRIYQPTTAQRHAVAIRDRHCAFPGCRRPAKWTEVHHIVPFPLGPTDLDNLVLLCDKHHHLVHEGHWKLLGTAFDFTVHRPDGSLFDHITRGPP
jgi:hypothetical protein